MIFKVQMPSDSYLALAFGASLDKCDMVLFQSDMISPTMSDCFYEEGNLNYVDFQ